MKKFYRVTIIESERGWGQRVDEVVEFPTLKAAKAFQFKYNEQNKETRVPDWYMYAQDPIEVVGE
jgi:hypothetical protein